MKDTFTGSYVGTGAAIDIPLGFTPSYIEVINLTDGDDAWKWFGAMTNGHAIYNRNVADNGTTGNASMSRITANGISAFAGSGTKAKGFTVGTALSENGKTFGYVAHR